MDTAKKANKTVTIDEAMKMVEYSSGHKATELTVPGSKVKWILANERRVIQTWLHFEPKKQDNCVAVDMTVFMDGLRLREQTNVPFVILAPDSGEGRDIIFTSVDSEKPKVGILWPEGELRAMIPIEDFHPI